MKTILSEDHAGCAIACLAMVTEQTYEEVASHFTERARTFTGLSTEKIMNYLVDKGYKVMRLSTESYGHDMREQILTPFADFHIIGLKELSDSKREHAVVMDAKGKLYCPDGVSDKETRKSYSIHESIGIWKV